MPSLQELTKQLAEGTRGQKRRSWRALVRDAQLWPACQAALHEGLQIDQLTAAYWDLSAHWDRTPLLEDELQSEVDLEAQIAVARRLVAAAVLTAAVQQQNTAENLLAWTFRASGHEPSVPLPLRPTLGGPAAESRLRETVRAVYAAFPVLANSLAAAQDACLSLLWSVLGEVVRPRGPRVRLPLLLAGEQQGYLAWLWLERVSGGFGQLFQAPCTSLEPVLPDLRKTIEASSRHLGRSLPPNEDFRWWLTDLPRDTSGHLLPVGGGSAAAAAAVGLAHLLADRKVHAHCAISATVLPDGRLGEVDGLHGTAPKLMAARGLATEKQPAVVIVGPGSQLSAPAAAGWEARGVRVTVAHTLMDAERLSAEEPRRNPEGPGTSARVTLLSAENKDRSASLQLADSLRSHGLSVAALPEGVFGVEWARLTDAQLRGSDAVVVLLTPEAEQSEMLSYQVQLATEAEQSTGTPRVVFLRTDPSLNSIGICRDSSTFYDWSPSSGRMLPNGVLDAIQLRELRACAEKPARLAPPTGVLPIGSQFYLERDADTEFHQAAMRGDSIIRIKGARQMGKTSLLARGLQQARDTGATVVLTDFQLLNQAHLENVDTFLITLAQWLSRQAGIDLPTAGVWDDYQGASVNFRDYLLELLERVPGPLVWGMDEVDRLFTCPFQSEFFGLLRSLHNDRALNPSLPWGKLTLTLCYATEAHLFLADLNQSPFNVGTRIRLDDFSRSEVSELNFRYGVPLGTPEEQSEFYDLLAGHPYLTHRSLHEMVTRNLSLPALQDLALREEGLFGDHLRRMLLLVSRDPELHQSIRELLAGERCSATAGFHRLWSAGVLIGDSAAEAKFRCRLYERYLGRHLR